MEATTIKLHQNTKQALETLKAENESYDQTIQRLITETRKKDLKKELVEAYTSMGKSDLELLEEWEPTSPEID